MARVRKEYELIGRYMAGKKVINYALKSLEDGQEHKFTPEQMAWLVGRGQVINCRAQLYLEDVLFRGVNVDIAQLPSKQVADPHPKKGRAINSEEVGVNKRVADISNGGGLRGLKSKKEVKPVETEVKPVKPVKPAKTEVKPVKPAKTEVKDEPIEKKVVNSDLREVRAQLSMLKHNLRARGFKVSDKIKSETGEQTYYTNSRYLVTIWTSDVGELGISVAKERCLVYTFIVDIHDYNMVTSVCKGVFEVMKACNMLKSLSDGQPNGVINKWPSTLDNGLVTITLDNGLIVCVQGCGGTLNVLEGDKVTEKALREIATVSETPESPVEPIGDTELDFGQAPVELAETAEPVEPVASAEPVGDAELDFGQATAEPMGEEELNFWQALGEPVEPAEPVVKKRPINRKAKSDNPKLLHAAIGKALRDGLTEAGITLSKAARSTAKKAEYNFSSKGDITGQVIVMKDEKKGLYKVQIKSKDNYVEEHAVVTDVTKDVVTALGVKFLVSEETKEGALIAMADVIKKSFSEHLKATSVQTNNRKLNSIMQFTNDSGVVLDVFLGIISDEKWTFRTDVDSITIGEEQVGDITKDIVQDRVNLVMNEISKKGGVEHESEDEIQVTDGEKRVLDEIARRLVEIGCVETGRGRLDTGNADECILGVRYRNIHGAVTLYMNHETSPEGLISFTILDGLQRVYYNTVEESISGDVLSVLGYEVLEAVRKVLK